MRRFLSLVAAAALLGAPVTALATDTSGWMLGLDFSTSHADFADPTGTSSSNAVFIDDNGAGANLLFGYGFTRSFALRANLASAQHNTTDANTEFLISSGTIEAMYVFRDPRAFRPYILGGVGGFTARSRQDDFDFDVTGPGVVLGAGFAYFMTPRFAFDFAARGDFINWDTATATVTLPGGSTATAEAPIEEEGSAAKLLFGVNWWFGRGQ